MRDLLTKLGRTVMLMALVAAQLNVNATCAHHIYQEEIPDEAKELSKYK